MKVAIVGYGVDGKASAEFFAAKGAEVVIFDQNSDLDTADYKSVLGDSYLEELKSKSFDLVIRSSGFPVHTLKESGISDWTTSVNYFFKHCPTKNTIGVTGTKGKGTTSTLIAKLLESADKKVFLGGNIGLSPLSFLDQITEEDYVVLELSSFQLIDCDFSPHIAVMLEIGQDHLDWHKDMDEYRNSKMRLISAQKENDVVIIGPHFDKNSRERVSELSPAFILDVERVVTEKNNELYVGKSKVISVSDLKVPGEHNVENIRTALLATSASFSYVFPETFGEDLAVSMLNTPLLRSFAEVLSNFTGLAHRIKYIRTVNGVDYVDDSYGTMPEATIAAVMSFKKPIHLILGGVDKGTDNAELGKLISEREIVQVYLIGTNKDRFRQLLNSNGYSTISEHESLEDAVKQAYNNATKGDVVLLSPACSSFDMFVNASDRGDKFIAIVKDLKE